MKNFKNVNIMGVLHFLEQDSHKKDNIYGELPTKELGRFAEDFAKNREEGVFEGGGGGGVDTSMHTMT